MMLRLSVCDGRQLVPWLIRTYCKKSQKILALHSFALSCHVTAIATPVGALLRKEVSMHQTVLSAVGLWDYISMMYVGPTQRL